MVFEAIDDLEPLDFYRILEKEPGNIKIINISDLQTGLENKPYFYIDYLLIDTNQEIGIAYNVKLVDNEMIIESNTKLYPILSFITELTSDKIKCNMQDIKEALTGIILKAEAEKHKVGNRSYYKILPVKIVGGKTKTD